MSYENRFLHDGNTNPVVTDLTHTAGTIAVSRCRQANIQWLASGTSSAYRIALKPGLANTATASRANCAAMVSNLGEYACHESGENYWVAYQVYNGSSPITAVTGDKLVIERLG